MLASSPKGTTSFGEIFVLAGIVIVSLIGWAYREVDANMDTLDVRGLSCPIPVLKTKSPDQGQRELQIIGTGNR